LSVTKFLEYMMYGLTVSMLVVLLIMLVMLCAGYSIVLKYRIEHDVEIPMFIVITLLCIVFNVYKMRGVLGRA